MNDEEKLQKKKEYNKEWRKENKEYFKQYFQENKEKLLEKSKKYYEEHKEEKKVYNKKYKEEHKEEQKEYFRKYKENGNKWYEKNKVELHAERKKDIITCECGRKMRRDGLKKHLKTNIHDKLISNKQI